MKKTLLILLVTYTVIPQCFYANGNANPLLGSAAISGGGTICPGDPIPDVVISLTGTAPWNITYSDGTSSTTVTASVSPYIISNGIDGTYTLVSVSDAVGSSTTSGSATILTNPGLTVALGVLNLICNGSCDGSINSIPSGGDGNYTYVWSNGANVPFISNLCAGQYDLNITDGNGCSLDTIIVLVGPAPVVINNIIEFDESCSGTCDGSFEVIASNASQYSIDGINFSASPIFQNLCAGNYNAYAQDANGCSTSVSVVIASPSAIGVQATSVSPICIGGSSLLSGSATGGTTPYTYSWVENFGAVVFTTQNGNVSPVVDAIYTLTVTDANGCVASTSTFVQVVSSITLSSASTDEIVGNDGAIDLIVSNANSTLLFDWDNDGTGDFDDNEDLTGLVAGTYTVIVDNGCELVTDSFIVASQVGVGEWLNDGGLVVYPNPSTNGFSVAFKDASSVKSVTVFDSKGSVVYFKETLFNSIEKIKLPVLVNGLLYLKIETEEGNYFKKILVL